MTAMENPVTPMTDAPDWPMQAVVSRPSGWRVVGSLWRRELTHFVRQPRRVVASLLTPLIFWLLLGSGLNRVVTIPTEGLNEATSHPTLGYAAYFFPGALVMTVMFATILGAYSVIEDRRAGFLQAVLVAPVSRLSIATGKIFGGANIAWLQGILFLAIWPLVCPPQVAAGWTLVLSMLAAVLVLGLLAVLLISVGFMLAWPTESTAGFHAVLNLVLFPAWFLSGAMFPLSSAPSWLAAVMWVNPLTWAQAALSSAITAQRIPACAPIDVMVSLPVTFALVVSGLLIAGYVASRRQKDGRS